MLQSEQASPGGGVGLSGIEPLAVSLKEAQRLLAGKSRAQIYVELGRGRLSGLKDGKKLLITVASIRDFMAALTIADINVKPSEGPKRRLAKDRSDTKAA